MLALGEDCGYPMQKDTIITELLNWLRERLGNTFTVTDYWEADLCAIGISAPGDPAQFSVHLELGPPRRVLRS